MRISDWSSDVCSSDLWAPLNVRVNCIGPGVIETEGFVMYPEEALKRFHQANPMKQRGYAWDVAEAITYLASPAGRFINGDLIIIDGGQAQWGVVWPAGIDRKRHSLNSSH